MAEQEKREIIEKACEDAANSELTVGELKKILEENAKYLSDDTKVIIWDGEHWKHITRWKGMCKSENESSSIFSLTIGKEYKIPGKED